VPDGKFRVLFVGGRRGVSRWTQRRGSGADVVVVG
jgi:hypothetical protein